MLLAQVGPKSSFLYHAQYRPNCRCGIDSAESLCFDNPNPLKIFKNTARLPAALSHFRYAVEEAADRSCPLCGFKYAIENAVYQECQPCEVLVDPKQASAEEEEEEAGFMRSPSEVTVVKHNKMVLWLLDPLLGTLEQGDCVSVTAFFFLRTNLHQNV